MTENLDPDRLARAIKRLTTAVWCLFAVVLAQLSFYVASYAWSMRRARERMTICSSLGSSVPRTIPMPTPEIALHELPPDQMVARSSVILLTTYQEEKDKYKAVVSEILKKDPNTVLYYSVGDEFPELSFHKEPGVRCGEGQVVFMVGSPASMRSSYSFSGGRLGGLGDMPMTILRQMIKGPKS
jgi:hypothetical protein